MKELYMLVYCGVGFKINKTIFFCEFSIRESMVWFPWISLYGETIYFSHLKYKNNVACYLLKLQFHLLCSVMKLVGRWIGWTGTTHYLLTRASHQHLPVPHTPSVSTYCLLLLWRPSIFRSTFLTHSPHPSKLAHSAAWDLQAFLHEAYQ